MIKSNEIEINKKSGCEKCWKNIECGLEVEKENPITISRDLLKLSL